MIFDPEKSLPDYADRIEAVVLYEAYLRAENTCQAFKDTNRFDELNDAAAKALEEYEVHGVDLLIDSLNNQVIRCALTGVPLLATVEDSEWVLKAAIEPAKTVEVEMAEAV